MKKDNTSKNTTLLSFEVPKDFKIKWDIQKATEQILSKDLLVKVFEYYQNNFEKDKK